jgi:FkbM family methyltransferase
VLSTLRLDNRLSNISGKYMDAAGSLRLIADRGVMFCAGLAQRHPYLWKFAWETIHRLPILLPHDKSYRALRHFIALRPEGLFLDVGANDGVSALSFRRFSTSYRILSLEPNPLLEPELKRLKESDPCFDYKIVGAGSVRERMKFFVPLYKNVVLHTFTSSNREHILAAIVESFGRAVADAVEIKEFDCDIIPIDALNLDPTIIKIDVEGLDYAVIQGLSATIGRAKPFIIIELGAAKYEQIKEGLSERDYVLLTYNISSDSFSPAPASFDASRYRNYFAVPENFVKSIPLK